MGEKKKATVAIIGLGYVGLPLFTGFAKAGYKVSGFDISKRRVEELNKLQDSTKETEREELEEAIKHNGAVATTDASVLSEAQYIIVTVPTPVTESKRPDLEPVVKAGEAIGKHIKKGTTVILESTVYPGVTEEVLGPTIEKVSGLKAGKDFKLAYSPERINPGDKEHRLETITKVVSGQDAETLEKVAQLYSSVVKVGVFRAKSIKVAEAAKVIENTQRDLNIALMNELALIFERLGISAWDVLEASYTKWNFGRYKPGLVGGHCIPVDPYYLVEKAEELGYHPQVITAGRRINDHMPVHVAQMAVKALNASGKAAKGAKVLLMGLTFKENVPDLRTSPAESIIAELKRYNMEITGFEPVAKRDTNECFGVNTITSLKEAQGKFDCAILAAGHDAFKAIPLKELRKHFGDKPSIVDSRGFYKRTEAEDAGFQYYTF